MYSTTSKNACSQGHFYAVTQYQIAQPRYARGGEAAIPCSHGILCVLYHNPLLFTRGLRKKTHFVKTFLTSRKNNWLSKNLILFFLKVLEDFKKTSWGKFLWRCKSELTLRVNSTRVEPSHLDEGKPHQGGSKRFTPQRGVDFFDKLRINERISKKDLTNENKGAIIGRPTGNRFWVWRSW